MIRTDVVALTVIHGAAYRQKMPSGGSAVVILREDSSQPGLAIINKKNAEPVPSENTPKDLFPQEAFKEAIALTMGLPYRKQGKAKLKGMKFEAKPENGEPKEVLVVVDGKDYQAIVDKYTDKTGKLSYELLNKDMIRFANSSKVVRTMIEEQKQPKAIREYAVGTKFRTIAKNPEMTRAQVQKIVDLLDEVSPKGVLKEFNDEIRKKLKAAKGK